jgi:hypothetical protein
MIAQRGLALRRQPGNYHTDRLRKMPIGHFYDVITNGYGIMFSYASRVEPDDRWRIAAYIRVLQRSQFAKMTDLPDNLDAKTRQSLESTAPPTPAATPETNQGSATQTVPKPGEIGTNPLPRPPDNSPNAGPSAKPTLNAQPPRTNGTNANGQ